MPVQASALLASFILVAAAAFFALSGGGNRGVGIANGGAPFPAAAPPAVLQPASTPAPDTFTHSAPGRPADVPATAAPSTRTPDTDVAHKRRRTRRPAATPGAVVIDLAGYSVLRADDAEPEASRRGATLPPALNRLRILLPEGSPRGVYRVVVADAYGRPLTVESAARSAGKQIVVSVDTRKLSGRRCWLRISRGGDAPDYYPINVSGR